MAAVRTALEQLRSRGTLLWRGPTSPRPGARGPDPHGFAVDGKGPQKRPGADPACSGCSSRVVLREDHKILMLWNILLALMLLYTGTVFPFRLTFLEFRIPEAAPENDAFEYAEQPINVMFWIDLLLGFITSYRDPKGREVCRLGPIVRHYLCGYFWLNFLACLPDLDVFFEGPLRGSTSEEDAELQRLMRLTRFRRIPRLVRLGRFMARLVRVVLFFGRHGLWHSLTHSRKVRVMRLLVLCTWTIHLSACGWYLCASLHGDPAETWVARRDLFDAGPGEQWLTSFYFVTTVFTTVGFGDMSASTWEEMVFACMLMVGGTILNGIIIGEVIHTIMVDTEETTHVNKRLGLVEQLSTHAELDDDLLWELRHWVKASGRAHFDDDTDAQTRLLTSAAVPTVLLERLPQAVYGGQLWRNRFLTSTAGPDLPAPPRLSVLVALSGYRRCYQAGDFVYRKGDLACNVFLVLQGTFAEVASRESSLDSEYRFRSPQAEVVSAMRRSGAGKEHHPPPEREAERQDSGRLCPYRLWSFSNYFGEVELFRPMPRQAYVRCETEAGSVLVVDKARFLQLLQEFSDLAAVWHKAARQRWFRRPQLERRLRQHIDARCLAASIIQRWVRGFLQSCTCSQVGRQPSSSRTSSAPSVLRSQRSLFWARDPSPLPRLHRVEESLRRIEAALEARGASTSAAFRM